MDGAWHLSPDPAPPTERRWLNRATGEFFFESIGLGALIPLEQWVRMPLSDSGSLYIFCPRDPVFEARRFHSDVHYQACPPWRAYVTEAPSHRIWWFNRDTEEFFFDL